MIDLLLFALVQVLSESLPISSSGHLRVLEVLLSRFVGDINPFCLTESFEYFLHGFACIVIAYVFSKSWFFMLLHPVRSRKILWKIFLLGFVTDVSTVAWYFLFEKVGTGWFPLWIGFFVTSAVLASLKFCKKRLGSKWNFVNALVIGSVQGLSLLPGISRLASSFAAARWVGIAPRRAIQISLLIQFPLIALGTVKGFVGVLKYGQVSSLLHPWFFLTMMVASTGAFLLLRLVASFAVTNRLWVFAPYTAVMGFASMLMWLLGLF